MKKRMILLLCAALVSGMWGCTPDEKNTEISSDISENTEVTQETEETTSVCTTAETTAETTVMTTSVSTTVTLSEEEILNQIVSEYEEYSPIPEWFPVIDGSTSAIPLDSGIRAAYLGLSQVEIESYISHTTTHQSFDNLLKGTVDAIYTVPVSDDQKAKADEAGIELEQIPVSREGFVFIVNSENPVDSLTQDQIRKIYSGEIRNWSEVGGNDEEIITLTRNQNSGSYNYMHEFMGDLPIVEHIKSEYTLGDMGGVTKYISGSAHENREAIGYSVFTYVDGMVNDDRIKFISVDGVEPSEESFRNGTYPLLSVTSLMWNAALPEDSEVRKLAEFIRSDAGKMAVEASGYVYAD